MIEITVEERQAVSQALRDEAAHITSFLTERAVVLETQARRYREQAQYRAQKLNNIADMIEKTITATK